MRDRFIATLLDIVRQDPDVVLISGDLGFKVFDEFRVQRPSQFINAGVAEQNMTGLATGMAMAGKICFTYSIGNFCTLRCLEQVRNDACYHEANVKIVSIGGGFSYGALGISHHATEDLAIMRSLPDLTVVSPSTLWETEQATRALYETPGTAYLRLDKSAGREPSAGSPPFELGKARCVREGRDLSILVCGGILEEAQAAAEVLATEGVHAGILSIHTLRPFDREVVRVACEATHGVVTLEEHTVHGGLGSAVAEIIAEESLRPARFLRIGLEAGFSCIVGSQKYLRSQYGLDAASLVTRVRSLL